MVLKIYYTKHENRITIVTLLKLVMKRNYENKFEINSLIELN